MPPRPAAASAIAAWHDVAVGDVALDGQGPLARLFRGPLEPVPASRQQRDVVAPPAEADPDATPQPTGCPDDHDPHCSALLSRC